MLTCLVLMVNFSTQISDCDSHSPVVLDLFISSDASICSRMAFPPLGNSDHVVVSVSIDFSFKFTTPCPVSSHSVWLLSRWLIWEIFYGRISLNSVLVLLLINFVCQFRLELMYISLIVSINSSLIHHHGLQLLVLLPYFVEITCFFVPAE